jgi:uncharacterized protein YjiS (DUF1127 family)
VTSYIESRQRQSGMPAHALSVLARNFLATVRIWWGRAHDRRELAARSERELRDMGTCWAEVADEVNKPFWRG